MAVFKYYADIDGRAIELARVSHDGHISCAARHFSGLTPDGKRVDASRKVQIKTNSPSHHQCNARCLGAQGHSPCECSCGGKNHGRGSVAA